MNTELMFSSKTDLWSTPQNLFDDLNNIHRFTLDCCASDDNAKCKDYYTEDDDGLTKEWLGSVWMNPPYGREISKWIKKAYSEALTRNCKVVALLPARTDTKWFHEYIYNKGVKYTFIKGRLKFGNCKNPAPFPSMIVEFNFK